MVNQISKLPIYGPSKATGFIGLKTGQYGDLVVLEQLNF